MSVSFAVMFSGPGTQQALGQRVLSYFLWSGLQDPGPCCSVWCPVYAEVLLVTKAWRPS